MSDRRFIDGDFSQPKQVSEWAVSHPLDFQPQTRLYTATFRQWARNFSELPINSPFLDDPNDDAGPASLSGTWTLKHWGELTAGIAVNATAAVVEAALRVGTITNSILKGVTGNWPEYFAEFLIDQAHPSGDNHLMAINANGISPAYKGKVALASHANKKKGKGAVQSIRLKQAAEAGISRAPVLVGEANPLRVMKNGLAFWERNYCNIPQDYVEYEGYNYQKQTLQSYRLLWNSWTDAWGTRHDQYVTFNRITEYTEPLIAKVAYTFCLGHQLGKNKGRLHLPYRIIHGTDSFGMDYAFSVGEWGYAEGSSAQRWKGDIHRIKNVIVNPY